MSDAAGTLHVDRVLADPLSVPHGLDHVLRGMERGAREQQTLLGRLVTRPDAAEPVRAAAEELDRFLNDEARSPLLRALRRPLLQIARGTPGGRSLERCWEGLRARSNAALELQAALDGIRAAVSRVRDRFVDELPRATREVLERERLGEADIARIGRAQDVAFLHRRLRRAELELERLWALVDPAAGAELQRGSSWAEEASPGELLTVKQLRLRERGRLLLEREGGRILHLLAARQVRALGQASGWRRPASAPTHAVAQRMAELLLRQEMAARGGEDLALWSELLGAATDTVHGGGRRTGWAAQLPDASIPAARETGSTRFVVPIDGAYALITSHLPSSVRVSDKLVALDRTVQCVVFLEHGDVETLPLARLDVEPLFEGLEEEPGWYTTSRKARLTVIAELGDGWIARLVQRGIVCRTRGSAWDPERSDRGRLRVLGTLAVPAPAVPWELGAAPGTTRVFCGLHSVPVAAPVVECAAGWLRVGSGSVWTTQAVEAEEECFRAIARKVPFTVPVWAGQGRLAERRLQGPLYVPPLGAHAADLPPLNAWLHSGAARPLLSAVARLWLRVTRAGYALGAYHVDAFAFSLGWGDTQEQSAAHAVVTDAPFAARLGQYHRRPPREEAHFPLYSGLGCRVLPPATAAGDVALPASEAQAFALFVLDTLAIRPLPVTGTTHAEALADMVPDLGDHFTDPATAARLAQVLRPSAETEGIMRLIDAFAGTGAH